MVGGFKVRALFAGVVLSFTALPASHAIATVSTAAEPPLFYIEPYWHPTGPTGDRFSLSWQYFLESDGPEVVQKRMPLTLSEATRGKTRVVRKVSASLSGDIIQADFGSLCEDLLAADRAHATLTVSLPFENKPRAVPASTCPRLLGATQGSQSKFIFMSDTQEFPNQTENTLRQLKNSDARLILNGGDLVQTGSDASEWQAYFDVFRDYLPTHVVVPIVGNHDYRYTANAPEWNRHFAGQASAWFFDFFVGDTQIIVFNSCFEDDPLLIPRQLAWMERTLQKPSRFKIVTMHHPPYSEGLANLDLAPRQEHARLRELFVPLFERYSVDLVLSGHTHLFERSIKDGIQYLVSGAAGGKMGWMGAFNPYSLFAREVRTLTEVSITNEKLQLTTWNDAGELEDRFTIPARTGR